MKTETIIAIILGVIVGGGLAVFLASKVLTTSIKKDTPNIPTFTEVKNEKDVPLSTQSATLTTFSVGAPINNIKVKEDKITVEAVVPSGSFVIIQSGVYEKVISFSNASVKEVVPLAKGENTIEVTAYYKSLPFGVQSKQLKVFSLTN
jgi:hypothetical protein